MANKSRKKSVKKTASKQAQSKKQPAETSSSPFAARSLGVLWLVLFGGTLWASTTLAAPRVVDFENQPGRASRGTFGSNAVLEVRPSVNDAPRPLDQPLQGSAPESQPAGGNLQQGKKGSELQPNAELPTIPQDLAQ